MECIIGDGYGIYIPQVFAQNYGHLANTDKLRADIDLLLLGPDNPDYWEIWDDVLENFRYTIDGKTYQLHQDSDLFTIEEGEEIPE